MDDPATPAPLQRALTAAHLYYVQDRTMEAIARELSTSRSTVSRLLGHARATGIVDIRIRSPLEAPRLLEERLAERFGVVAHVVPVPDDASEVERLQRVAVAAAHTLHEVVHADLTIGVAWGSTTAAMSRHLVPRPVHGTTFVQLNGSGNTRTTGLLYASEILSGFAAAYGGTAQQFPVPAFFDDPATKQAMWRERSTQRILAMQSADGRHRVQRRLRRLPGAEPRLRGRLPRAARISRRSPRTASSATSRPCSSAQTDRATASPSTRARPDRTSTCCAGCRCGCCVVSGVSKLASLRGALAAGLATDVVLDEATARLLADEPARATA